MRILSEAEMDHVFAGQATAMVTTNEQTVTVQGFRVTQQSTAGGYWIGGPSFNYDEYSGGNAGGSYHPTYPAVPNATGPEKLKCIMDSVAVAGADLRTDYRFAVVNSYAYWNSTNNDIRLSQTMIANPPGYTAINGLTVTPGGSPYVGTSIIYAGAIDGQGSLDYGSYYNTANGAWVASYNPGVLTPIEQAVMTTAHEARHQYTNLNPSLLLGPDREADARGYAIKALEHFRANPPNCR